MKQSSSHLIFRWQQGMNRVRHKADSGDKYSFHFKLLYDKIEEYSVEPTRIFNMDENGFQLGELGRSERVFDKVIYSQKGLLKLFNIAQQSG
jgi:hypothetical protein